MNTESTSTETTANGHTPRRARSTRPAEALAYVPGQLKSLRKAALARLEALKKELVELCDELGLSSQPLTTSTAPIVNCFTGLPSVGADHFTALPYVGAGGSPASAVKPPVKARARKPAPAAADASPATPRAKRGSNSDAVNLAIEDIVGKLRSIGEPLSSERLQALTGLEKGVVAMALKRGVKDGTLTVSGVKRSSKYSVKPVSESAPESDA